MALREPDGNGGTAGCIERHLRPPEAELLRGEDVFCVCVTRVEARKRQWNHVDRFGQQAVWCIRMYGYGGVLVFHTEPPPLCMDCANERLQYSV